MTPEVGGGSQVKMAARGGKQHKNEQGGGRLYPYHYFSLRTRADRMDSCTFTEEEKTLSPTVGHNQTDSHTLDCTNRLTETQLNRLSVFLSLTLIFKTYY